MVLRIGPQKRSPLSPVEDVSDLDQEDCRCEGCGTPDAWVAFPDVIVAKEVLLLCGKCALLYIKWKEGAE